MAGVRTVGCSFARLILAFHRHCEKERERVLAGAAGSEKDERMRKPAGGDGGAKVLNRVRVADEVVEGGRKGHLFRLPRALRRPLRDHAQGPQVKVMAA